jgi:hypothetical protein
MDAPIFGRAMEVAGTCPGCHQAGDGPGDPTLCVVGCVCADVEIEYSAHHRGALNRR